MAARNYKSSVRGMGRENEVQSMRQKALHGKHRYRVTQVHINGKQSYTWLQDGQLFPEMEGFMLAIQNQDQVIATRNYKKCIIKDPSITDDSCRKCRQQKETMDHITGACRTLTGTEYSARHNSAAKQLLAKRLGYLFKARKYKAQIRPRLEYCSHIWGAAAPTSLSILDAVQRRAIRLIGDPALTFHIKPLSHRRRCW
nr:unnamed protein product [Callosobruchus chinensis]